MGGKCPSRSSLPHAVAGFANKNFPSGGTSEVRPFASAPLIPCKLISSLGQASVCHLRGGVTSQRRPAGKKMPCVFLYPVWRGCNYMCCFSTISLKELLSFQESLERSWLHLLQGQIGTKITTCSPLHCAENKPRLLLASLGLVATHLGGPLFRGPQGSWKVSGRRQGTRQAGSTILSLGSTPLRIMWRGLQMRAAILGHGKNSFQIPCVPAIIQPHSKVHWRQ